MWESPIYTFEKEVSENGKITKKQFHINVTYSAPRNNPDPGTQLANIFSYVLNDKTPSKTHILDVGAAKLRNTLWLLQKGYHVWSVEFPELKNRLKEAKDKWDEADKYPNFHKVSFPRDFFNLNGKFDLIMLVNVINVMPIPTERYALISLIRDKLKEDGHLLWHQWRALSITPDRYTEENKFIDGYLLQGPNHTFYAEYDKEETHEILYSLGFQYNKERPLSKYCGINYSYLFKPTHEILISNSLDLDNLIKTKHDPKEVISNVALLHPLRLYLDELKTIKPGKKEAHKYHLIASRVFYQLFNLQLHEPILENEINEGRGRIDIVYRNKNKDGIFKNLKELREIKCPEIFVECKNYSYDLESKEYAQLSTRLIPKRGMLGFLLCRDKKNAKRVLKHCQDANKEDKYIIVLDDQDLTKLANYKLEDEDDERINEFVDNKVKEIID